MITNANSSNNDDISSNLNQANYTIQESDDDLKNKRILVVGAGGIGCELLKCLVMSGIRKITIVDLDKIEKSNLNRQFLFNQDCIGNYKSEMAKVSVLTSRNNDPDLNIESLVGNIKDKSKFSLDFFKKFDLILNALDNVDARTYINRICIINKIPLVNSGTEGFLGNVGCYIRDLTPCYNCAPKQKQKAIPICSIRSKPEKIEHCVAWAKALFELLYCENTNGNYLEDYKIEDDSKKNFQNYFFYNILILKESEANPLIKPIDIYAIHGDISDGESLDQNIIYSYSHFNTNLNKYDDNLEISSDNKFLISLLLRSSHKLSQVEKKFAKFDKEDKDIVNFVFAATNMRAINFGLKNESRFKIKEIAGNIIPAIASTNAVIAAIQTIEAIKVLRGKYDFLRNVNFTKEKKIASVSSKNDMKWDKCPVCSPEAIKKSSNQIELVINSDIFTLGNLINVVAGEKFKIEYPQIYFNNNLLFESGDDLDEEEIEYYEDLKSRSLSTFNIKKGDEVKISDLKGRLNINFNIIQETSFSRDDKFEIKGEFNRDISSDEEMNIIQEEEGEANNSKRPINEAMIDLDAEVGDNDGEIMVTNLTFINNKRKQSQDILKEDFPQEIKKRRIDEN